LTSPLEKYLTSLRETRSTGAGVPETFYYSALQGLLKDVGKTLKPRTPQDVIHRLGERTYDVYLYDFALWRSIPERVWGFTIGGYQVLKKWLSYREHDILGRSLTSEETREVTSIARRIAGILLLEPALDTHYRSITSSIHPWPRP
jgi:hypothetical protein